MSKIDSTVISHIETVELFGFNGAMDTIGNDKVKQQQFRNNFDYVNDDIDFELRFFLYRGDWYDLNEFEIIRVNAANPFSISVSADSPYAKWEWVQTDSYFSATLARCLLSLDDGERATVEVAIASW